MRSKPQRKPLFRKWRKTKIALKTLLVLILAFVLIRYVAVPIIWRLHANSVAQQYEEAPSAELAQHLADMLDREAFSRERGNEVLRMIARHAAETSEFRTGAYDPSGGSTPRHYLYNMQNHVLYLHSVTFFDLNLTPRRIAGPEDIISGTDQYHFVFHYEPESIWKEWLPEEWTTDDSFYPVFVSIPIPWTIDQVPRRRKRALEDPPPPVGHDQPFESEATP